MNSKDKRLFERRKKRVAFSLLINGKPFRAETTDYSMAGIGAIVEDSPPVTPGDTLDVDIPQSSIRFRGQVVRSEKLTDCTKVGIMRLTPIAGSFDDYSLSDIIIGIQRSGRTGVLDVRHGSVHKWVYVNAGDMVFAGSNQPSDRLGDMLLAEGKITQKQYEESSDLMLKTGKRHGAVLVEMGYLKPSELPLAVIRYVEKIIESLFSIRTGTFEFREMPLPKEEVITLKLSAANLIYRGIKNADIEVLRPQLPPLEAVPAFSQNPLDLFQDLRLDDSGKRILTLIDGKTPIKSILPLVGRNEDDALKSILALLETRVIEIAGDTTAPSISAEEVISEPKEDTPSELIAKIEGLYEKCEELDYYSILGLKDTATASDIKRAYYKMAKEYHPDKHYRLPSDMKFKLNKVFSYITTAYATLSHPERRKDYDRTLTVKPTRLGSNTENALKRFEEGKAAFRARQYDEAQRLFAEAAYLDGSIPRYHFYEGLALGRLGRYKEAGRCIERALQKEPMNAEYLAEAGHIFIALGMHARARGSFEKALKVEPSNQRAMEGLAKLQESK